jgi:hypothetical protein
MMHARLAGIDLSKPGQSFVLHAEPEAWQQASEGVEGLDFALEDEFGAREKADGHSRLARRSEASRFGPRKSR